MISRIGLFLITNLAVMFVLMVVLNLLGIQGGSITGVVIVAGLFGMGGSFISLLMSKSMAKRATGAHVIEQPRNDNERWLLETVQAQAQRLNIGMPEVAIFSSPTPNAFATGANRNDALVAVSTGLLEQMNADEVEAVLGHEMAHVANGDMVTMTLIQGVVNTFVIVIARVVAGMLSRNQSGGTSYGMYFAVSMVAEVVLGFLASMIVFAFSRWREFRADIGGARLASRQQMISALERLRQIQQPSRLPDEMAAFGIIGGIGKGLKALFSTHPPLEDRIAALRSAQL